MPVPSTWIFPAPPTGDGSARRGTSVPWLARHSFRHQTHTPTCTDAIAGEERGLWLRFQEREGGARGAQEGRHLQAVDERPHCAGLPLLLGAPGLSHCEPRQRIHRIAEEPKLVLRPLGFEGPPAQVRHGRVRRGRIGGRGQQRG